MRSQCSSYSFFINYDFLEKTEESNDDKCVRRVLSDIDILFRYISFLFYSLMMGFHLTKLKTKIDTVVNLYTSYLQREIPIFNIHS